MVLRPFLLAAVCVAVGQSFWQPALAMGPQEEPTQSALSAVFVRNLGKTDEQNADLIKQACAAKENGQYSDAIALYLAAASGPLYHQKFAVAKPTLDIAFSLVPELTGNDKRQVVIVIARILEDFGSGSGLPDASDNEYFCLKSLEITRIIPGSVPLDRADATIRLAFVYSYWRRDRVREAEAMLVQLLAELENTAPTSLNIDRCLEALGLSYEIDEQLPYAKQCWERRIKFVKAYEPRTFADVLEKYVLFLLEHKLFKAAAPVADELLAVAWRPDQTVGPDQRPWEKFGNDFGGFNDAESDKFFRVAYDLYTNDPKLIASYGYGTAALGWSASLQKQGKKAEAIEVLKRALDFSQRYKDTTSLRMRPHLFCRAVEYLREDSRTDEADLLEAAFHRDETETAVKNADDDRKQLDIVMSDSKASPQAQVAELTKNAYLALENHHCDEGLSLLNRAVSLYEKNSSADADGRMYDCFQDVRSKLSAYGQFETGTEILWRLIGARMKTGMDDPEFPRFFSFHQRQLWPAQELFPLLQRSSGASPAADSDLQKLLSIAKESGLPANMIFALVEQKRHLAVAHPAQSRIAVCEEIEVLRQQATSPQKHFAAMFETAEEYVRQDKFAAAKEKWRSALTVNLAGSGPCLFPLAPLPWYLNKLGTAFFEKNRLEDARQIFLESYKTSFEPEGRDRNHWVFEKIRILAWKYLELHDLHSAESLLNDAMSIAQSRGAEGSKAVSDIYFTLAHMYVVNKLPTKAADAFGQFLLAAKLDKNDPQHQEMIAAMRQYVEILKDKGYIAQSGAILAQADTVEKTEAEKLKTEQANRPKSASPAIVLSRLDRLIK